MCTATPSSNGDPSTGGAVAHARFHSTQGTIKPRIECPLFLRPKAEPQPQPLASHQRPKTLSPRQKEIYPFQDHAKEGNGVTLSFLSKRLLSEVLETRQNIDFLTI